MSQGQELGSVLDREIDCLQALLQVLEAEREALLSGDVDAIEHATAAKNGALAAQGEATLSRESATSRFSVDNTDEGMRQLIAGCENRERLDASLSRLRALAAQCRDGNRANGRLILQKQEHARGALNVIRQTGASTPIYSGQGKATAAAGTRSLGKA